MRSLHTIQPDLRYGWVPVMTLTDYWGVRNLNPYGQGILVDMWTEGTEEGPRIELGLWHSNYRYGHGRLFIISNMTDNGYEAEHNTQQEQLARYAAHREYIKNGEYAEWYTGESYTLTSRIARPIYAALAELTADQINKIVEANSRDEQPCEHIFSQNDMGDMTCDFCGEPEGDY